MIGLLSLFIFAIPEKFDGSHMAIYNQLPEVEMSDAEIKARPDFSTFLENFGNLVRKHGLEDAVGLRLVHKHFLLEPKSENTPIAMVEDFELVDGIPSLVTQAREITAQIQGTYPASWLFLQHEEQGIPFEFSNDPAIKATRDRIDASPDFFNTARHLIVDSQYSRLLSLAILKRKQLLLDDAQLVLIEKSYEEFGSVIQLVDKEKIQFQKIIQTSWVFTNDKGPKQVACYPVTYCFPWFSGHRTVRDHTSSIINDILL